MIKVPQLQDQTYLYVVDCGERVYVGRVLLVGSTVFVYNGYSGRPPAIPLAEINDITPVEQHPDVEISK